MPPPSRTNRRPAPEPAPASSSSRPRLPDGYWSASRGASAALLIVLPLLAGYEGGLASLGGDPALRTGVDSWIQQAIPPQWGLPAWAPSLTIALALVCWRVAEPGRFRPRWLPVAAVESTLLGAGLLGLYLLFDRWLAGLGGLVYLRADSWPSGLPIDPSRAIGLVGAGIFEEAAFRLGLLGLLYAALRVLHVPNALATAMAASGSALAFSLAHHVHEPPGDFAPSVFLFRWLAGVYFAWVFILRGFGIAVGTHVAYDLLVAAYPWPDR
ncbi:CPBP family glutamic-type intramembrane protease [Tautonia sociabilis]|nr:CPBP family glutamic-type intramembrane protease [Tautonia sociabilis]